MEDVVTCITLARTTTSFIFVLLCRCARLHPCGRLSCWSCCCTKDNRRKLWMQGKTSLSCEKHVQCQSYFKLRLFLSSRAVKGPVANNLLQQFDFIFKSYSILYLFKNDLGGLIDASFKSIKFPGNLLAAIPVIV